MSGSSRTGFRHVQSKERENLPAEMTQKIPLSAHFWLATWPLVSTGNFPPQFIRPIRGFHSTPPLSLRVPTPPCADAKGQTRRNPKLFQGHPWLCNCHFYLKAKLFHCPWVNGQESTGSLPTEAQESSKSWHYTACYVLSTILFALFPLIQSSQWSYGMYLTDGETDAQRGCFPRSHFMSYTGCPLPVHETAFPRAIPELLDTHRELWASASSHMPFCVCLFFKIISTVVVGERINSTVVLR